MNMKFLNSPSGLKNPFYANGNKTFQEQKTPSLKTKNILKGENE